MPIGVGVRHILVFPHAFFSLPIQKMNASLKAVFKIHSNYGRVFRYVLAVQVHSVRNLSLYTVSGVSVRPSWGMLCR